MGVCHSDISKRILLLGLDTAGKTALLYKMRLGELVTTIPTIGFNVESVTPLNGLEFTIWDVGGQERLRPLWRHYYNNADGLIFVVDSADKERISEARQALFDILENDEMKGVPVCILANKKDLPNTLSPSEVEEQLNLNKLTDRKWCFQAVSVVTGEGIYEGMRQFASLMKERKK